MRRVDWLRGICFKLVMVFADSFYVEWLFHWGWLYICRDVGFRHKQAAAPVQYDVHIEVVGDFDRMVAGGCFST